MATTSGYARTVRLWWRGTGADQAPVIFDIAADLMAEPIAMSTIPLRERGCGSSIRSARVRRALLYRATPRPGTRPCAISGTRDLVTRDRDVPRAVAIACIAVVAHQASHVVEVNAFVFSAYRSQAQADIDEHLMQL